MKLILKLVIKYLKLNPKRAGIAIVSIIFSVLLLTLSCNLFVWGFDYMQETEILINGSWHARYNNLNQTQVELLEQRSEFTSCQSEEISEGIWQADVELKKVNQEIFAITQNIGHEIGMTSLHELGVSDFLPNGESATYDIYYHMDLLDFYGITEENSGASMKAILLGILAIIMGITSLLIYSVFALSFLEKKKYIGLLSCVGASTWQRRMFVLGEGIAVALFSIPVGLLLGCIASLGTINILKETLNATYQLSINLPATIDFSITLFAALLGMITIGFGALIPTIQAGKISALELIFKAGDSAPEELHSKYHPQFSLAFNMALRNLVCNKKKSGKMILFAILSICIAFNGYIAIQDMRGVWLLKDTRAEKPLDAWVQIYSDDVSLEDGLIEEIEKMDWCESANYMNVLDIGAFIIGQNHVKEEWKTCYLPWWQMPLPTTFWDERQVANAEEHYAFPAKIVGIDDETFELYLKEYGDNHSLDFAKKAGKYAVIIDDYIPIGKTIDDYYHYHNVLSTAAGEDIQIQFGAYADYHMSVGYLDRGGTTEDWNKDISLHVCAMAKERLPFSPKLQAWGMTYDDSTQMESYYIRFYMPNSQFQQFVKEDSIINTYGSWDLFALDSQNHLISECNPILNYICIDRAPNASEQQMKNDLLHIMNNAGLRPYIAKEEEYPNDSFSWEYGNIESLNRMKLMKNAGEILREIFLIGAILFILFLTIFSFAQYMATSIYMRKHEFAVLMSLGMDYSTLKRMLLYENVLLILLGALIGSSFSWWEAYTQLRDIRHGAATIEISFPFGTFIGIVGGIILLTVGIAFIMVHRVKDINIMDALKNENE